MKKTLVLCWFAASLAAVCLVTADEKPRSASDGPAAKSPAAKSAAKTFPPRMASNAGASAAVDGGPIQDLGASLIKAFNHRDAAAFAAAFTANGEYIDETGTAFHGRRAIEEEFTKLFAANPGTKIHVHFDAPRIIAGGVVAADGQTRFTRAAGEQPVAGTCSIVCVKEGSQWLIASLREVEPTVHHATHHEQVGQLEWLIGDWIDEGSKYHVHFSCRWDETGNYLLRDFSVYVGGEKTSSGTQRIGYDPLTEHLKAWVFDSSGGYSDGYMHRDGESWTLHSSGVTGDGRMASGTNVFTKIDDHRMAWQALDCVVGGERIADTGKIVIVRKPPAPTARGPANILGLISAYGDQHG